VALSGSPAPAPSTTDASTPRFCRKAGGCARLAPSFPLPQASHIPPPLPPSPIRHPPRSCSKLPLAHFSLCQALYTERQTAHGATRKVKELFSELKAVAEDAAQNQLLVQDLYDESKEQQQV
jgi:hypothetical protein